MALDKVIDSAALDAGMTSVADAIRAKAGTTDPLLWPDGFETAIEAISGGGGVALIIGAENLHDSSTDIADTYLAASTGTETKYSGWNCTDYIPIEAGRIYNVVCMSINPQYCFLYNENKNLRNHTYFGSIGRSISATGNDVFFLFIAPTNGYVRFSGQASNITALELHECAGSIELAAETYTDAVVYSDDIPAEVALDILTGGGPE